MTKKAGFAKSEVHKHKRRPLYESERLLGAAFSRLPRHKPRCEDCVRFEKADAPAPARPCSRCSPGSALSLVQPKLTTLPWFGPCSLVRPKISLGLKPRNVSLVQRAAKAAHYLNRTISRE